MKFLLIPFFWAMLCLGASSKEAEETVGGGLKITSQMHQVWETKERPLNLQVKTPPPLWEQSGWSKPALNMHQPHVSCKMTVKTSGSLVSIMKVFEGDHTNLGVGLRYFFRVRVFYC